MVLGQLEEEVAGSTSWVYGGHTVASASLLVQAPDPQLSIDLERSEKGLPGGTKGLAEGFTPRVLEQHP